MENAAKKMCKCKRVILTHGVVGGNTAEMGLISPGGENLLDFLELRQVLSTYDGDLRDLLWWP